MATAKAGRQAGSKKAAKRAAKQAKRTAKQEAKTALVAEMKQQARGPLVAASSALERVLRDEKLKSGGKKLLRNAKSVRKAIDRLVASLVKK